jgi:heme-degrading monooxygenase HmoA
VEPDLHRMPGFQKRALYAGQGGLWADHVWWESLSSAFRAYEEFQGLESGVEMESLLDPQTVEMYHLEVVYQDRPEQMAQPGQADRTRPVVELVIARLVEGVSQQDYTNAAAALELDLRNLPGYLSRQLAFEPRGLWVDIVYWNSLEQAMAVAQAFRRLESARPVEAMLDPASVRIYHLEPVYIDTSQPELAG